MAYKAEPIPDTRTKYFIIDENGERVAILEDRDAEETNRGWRAWSWDDGYTLLSGSYAGATLEYVVSVADEWL